MAMKVLVATDGSECSREAIERLPALVPLDDLEAVVISVAPIPVPADVTGMGVPFADYNRLIDEVQVEARQHADEAAHALEARGIRTRTVIGQGDAAHGILELAGTEKPDLIVVGSHGRSGLKKLLLGSVSARIVSDAVAPVLVIKAR